MKPPNARKIKDRNSPSLGLFRTNLAVLAANSSRCGSPAFRVKSKIMLSYFQILVLAIIQGACELLPVSSSAHVIAAEKLMGLDPSSPEMTMLLVLLHTGTMFALSLIHI